jgi:HEAT repeat protein
VRIDPEGRECIPTLVTALGQAGWIAADAADSLSLLGPRASDAVPALVRNVTRDFGDELDNGDPQVSAARALARIGPAARSAIPGLTDALNYRRVVEEGGFGKETDCSAAAAAAEALGTFGPEARAAVPALIEALKLREPDDQNWEVRIAAALALGRIGADARTAVPALRAAIKENDVQVAGAAAIALLRLEPDGREAALRWVESRERPGGWEAECRAAVLGAMGRTSVEAEALTRLGLERLNRAVATAEAWWDDTTFLEDSFRSLGRFGAGARSAVPRLKELCSHRNPWVRLYAGETLKRVETGTVEP